MMHTIIILDILAKPAFYLDPGSGSMIIQMVIAAVLGLGVATRVFWKNIKGWFTKNKGTAEAELDPTEIAEPESPEEPKN